MRVKLKHIDIECLPKEKDYNFLEISYNGNEYDGDGFVCVYLNPKEAKSLYKLLKKVFEKEE
jgi:hypothetical protein